MQVTRHSQVRPMLRYRSLMKTPRSVAAVAALVVFTAACSGLRQDDGSEQTVQVFKSFGSVQCHGGGADLATLSGQLLGAGLSVRDATCGSDGLMHMTVCGAGDGRIGIFEIAAGDLSQAEQLGFTPLSQLPDAEASPCR